MVLVLFPGQILLLFIHLDQFVVSGRGSAAAGVNRRRRLGGHHHLFNSSS
jgi:hypothetical protein